MMPCPAHHNQLARVGSVMSRKCLAGRATAAPAGSAPAHGSRAWRDGDRRGMLVVPERPAGGRRLLGGGAWRIRIDAVGPCNLDRELVVDAHDLRRRAVAAVL